MNNDFDKVKAEWAKINADLKASTTAVKVIMFIITPLLAVGMLIGFMWGFFSSLFGIRRNNDDNLQ